MGCDACYTNHAECDQNDIENLRCCRLRRVNYLMGILAGDDVMLNYERPRRFTINAALREIYALRPAPEFEAWMERASAWAVRSPHRACRRRPLLLNRAR